MPLSYLEEDIDAASDIVGTDIDAIAAMDLADLIASGNDVPAVAAAEENTQSPVDLISDDDVMANTEMPRAEASTLNSRFEAVSDAALELELEENASAGLGDLPKIVNAASAAFTTGDATDEADTIAALALAMEEEAKADNAPPPAQSDIRSMMLRVEALAKKAEAMRLAKMPRFLKAAQTRSTTRTPRQPRSPTTKNPPSPDRLCSSSCCTLFAPNIIVIPDLIRDP